MASYPIKILKDENNNAFIPLVDSRGIVIGEGGQTLEEKLNVKLEKQNIIAGNNITIQKNGNNCTINAITSPGFTLIDNLNTNVAGIGALDAHQGKIIKESIPVIVNNLTTPDDSKVLSAYQGYLLKQQIDNIENIPVGVGRSEGEKAGEIFNSYESQNKNLAPGEYSHAEGYLTQAIKEYSHAEGSFTRADGENSHAEGTYTSTNVNNSHIGGQYGELRNDTNTLFAIANGIDISNKNIGLKFQGLKGNGKLYVEGKEVLTIDSIINNLTSSDTNKSLSANQGRLLNNALQQKANTTSGTIGGWHITDTSLWAELKPPKDYTQEDLDIVRNIVSNGIIPTKEQLHYYDFDKDGQITLTDLVRISMLMDANISNTHPGKVVLDTTNYINPIVLKNGNGVTVDSMSAIPDYCTSSGSNENGKWIKFSDGTMIITQEDTQTVNGNYPSTTPTFPVIFKEPPFVTYSYKDEDAVTTNLVFRNGPFVDRATSALYLRYAEGYNSVTITINILAIGRWK